MTTFKIAVMPGDGIGTEVVPEGLKVLSRAIEVTGTDATLQTEQFEASARRWHETGETLTDDELERLRDFDAIRASPPASWSAASSSSCASAWSTA
jgi:3-isopropylmalate dehydrogenase